MAVGGVKPNPSENSVDSALETAAPASSTTSSWIKAKDTTKDVAASIMRWSNEFEGIAPGKQRALSLNGRLEVYDMGEASIELLDEAEEALKKFQEPVSVTIEELREEAPAVEVEERGGGGDVRVHVEEEDEALEDEALEGTVAKADDEVLTGDVKAAQDLQKLGKDITAPLEKARDKREWTLRLHSIGLIALGILGIGVGLAIMCAGAATMNPAAAVGLGVLGMFIAGASATYVGYKFREHMHTFHGETPKHEALGKQDDTVKNHNEEIERVNRMNQKLADPAQKNEIVTRVNYLNSKQYKIDKDNYSNFVKGYEEFEKALGEIKKNEGITAREIAFKRRDLAKPDLSDADRARLQTELDALEQKYNAIQASKETDRLNELLEQKLNTAGVHPHGTPAGAGQGAGAP